MAGNNGQQTTPTWCKCENCVDMPTEQENLCCFSVEGNVPHEDCLIKHIEFIPKVLDIQAINKGLGDMDEHSKSKQQSFRREKAYRRFHNWFFGSQGEGNRKPNPSCVVAHIRSNFPDPNNEYEGFRDGN